jgi:putative DNA primase/helicase
VSRFIVLPKWASETLALWILHTYAFELRDVSTYIGIESPEKRCGKTTLLTLLGRLVNRPVAAANISSSAFFRVIQETRPTLLIDEADTFLQGNDELRGILNAGYNRETAFVMRVASERCVDIPENEPFQNSEYPSPNRGASDRTTRLAKYSCWCPKVMAAIGHLPDTLADRCIVIRMQRKTSREECQRLRNLSPANLKEQCARFILDHTAIVDQI